MWNRLEISQNNKRNALCKHNNLSIDPLSLRFKYFSFLKQEFEARLKKFAAGTLKTSICRLKTSPKHAQCRQNFLWMEFLRLLFEYIRLKKERLENFPAWLAKYLTFSPSVSRQLPKMRRYNTYSWAAAGGWQQMAIDRDKASIYYHPKKNK